MWGGGVGIKREIGRGNIHSREYLKSQNSNHCVWPESTNPKRSAGCGSGFCPPSTNPELIQTFTNFVSGSDFLVAKFNLFKNNFFFLFLLYFYSSRS